MPDIFVAPKKEEPKEEPPEEEKVKDAVQPVEEKPETKAIQESPEQKGGSLSAFIAYPDSVRFDTQEEQEQIVLLLRQHWVTNIFWVLATIFLLVIPILGFPFLLANKTLPSIPSNFILIFTLAWYLVVFGFALVNFINWYFNVYIVTNERIIDIDFIHLLYKQLSSTRIGRVQDITYKLGGVFRAIFDFGDVYIQTAGTEPNFDFVAVPHPEQVVRVIGELTEKREEET